MSDWLDTSTSASSCTRTHRVTAFSLVMLTDPGAEIVTHLISNERLAGVWARLRDRLSAVDSSLGMVYVTKDYAAHFYNMYVNKHEGKHLTGDRVRIILPLLSFLLRDLIAPEVRACIFCVMPWYIGCYISCHGQGATHAILRAREQDSNPAPQL